MQLVKIQTLTATLELLSGTRIGASEGEIRIGGVDNQVIRNPITGEPYLPGSSLKGKTRSLLEWCSGDVQPEPLNASAINSDKPLVLPILQLFGAGAGHQTNEEDARKLGPSRLAFWDAPLQQAWSEELRNTNLMLTETKTENQIDRIRGVAQHPRQTERVPAGSLFEFRLSMKVLDNDDAERMLGVVLAGLRLLELDSLGGSGSRGYGKVRFRDMKLGEQDLQDKFASIDPFTVAAR